MKRLFGIFKSRLYGHTSWSFLLALVSLLVLFMVDMIWDTHEKISSRHFITDILIILSIAYLSRRIWQRFHHDLSSHSLTQRKLDKSNQMLQQQSVLHSRLKDGLAARIQEMFDRWKLSPTEKEIALLIVKGFSLDEIAKMRHKSERTIRDQAAAIYRKANVKNRIELSSYFIEDLMHFDAD